MGNHGTKQKNKINQLSRIEWDHILEYLENKNLLTCIYTCKKLQMIGHDFLKARILTLEIIENELMDAFENMILDRMEENDDDNCHIDENIRDSEIFPSMINNDEIWRKILLFHNVIDTKFNKIQEVTKNMNKIKEYHLFFNFVYRYANDVGKGIGFNFEYESWINVNQFFIAFLKMLFFRITFDFSNGIKNSCLFDNLQKNHFFLVGQNTITFKVKDDSMSKLKQNIASKYEVCDWMESVSETYDEIKDDLHWMEVKNIEKTINERNIFVSLEVLKKTGRGSIAYQALQKINQQYNHEHFKYLKLKRIVLCDTIPQCENEEMKKIVDKDRIFISFESILNVVKF